MAKCHVDLETQETLHSYSKHVAARTSDRSGFLHQPGLLPRYYPPKSKKEVEKKNKNFSMQVGKPVPGLRCISLIVFLKPSSTPPERLFRTQLYNNASRKTVSQKQQMLCMLKGETSYLSGTLVVFCVNWNRNCGPRTSPTCRQETEKCKTQSHDVLEDISETDRPDFISYSVDSTDECMLFNEDS